MTNAHRNATRYARYVAYVTAVILINIAGLSLFYRFDLTGNKVYSLSKVSTQVVSSLSEPLTVNVFFTKDLPAPYNTVERYLRDLLGEYAIYGGRNFNYRFYDVTPEDEGGSAQSTENRKLAQDYGLYPVQIQAIEKDEVKFKKAFMGLVILHGDMMERIPTITETDGLEYRITTSIMKLGNKVSTLLKLKDPVDIRLYISPSLREVAPYMSLKDMPGLATQVSEIVGRLNKKMYDRITFSLVEPEELDEIKDLSKRYGLMHFQWGDIKGTNLKAGNGIIGIVVEHGSNTSVLPVIQVYRIPLFGTRYNFFQPEELDEMISQGIESVIGINEGIGYLADHGTLQVSAMPGNTGREPIANFGELVSQSYTLRQVQLGETGIPKGIRSLVIASPMEPFSDWELYQIDQALMQGTSLAVFLDRFQEVQYGQPGSPFAQQSQFMPVNTGLEKLLVHYGARVEDAIVLDEKCYKQRLPVEYGGGEQDVPFAPIIQEKNINTELPYMRNIKTLITLASSPVAIDEGKLAQHEARALRLFSSSERSWEMRDSIVLNPMYIKPPKSDKEMRSRPLAYLLEGSFKSYFTGKPIPEKPLAADAGQEEPGVKDPASAAAAAVTEAGTFLPKSTKPGRIFLIGSSQILANNLLDTSTQNPGATFVMNMLDVLNDRVDISLLRSKTLTINPLDDIQARSKMFIKYFNIAGVPALIAAVGLLAWVRRRIRKKRIELMFARRAS
ncbi:MAG TPA: Gldg family protein [Deltaproteobacteria bacterium]|nr:Gldg family protein [Deltaproteobacteria bacterium]HOI08076.1 Gldg family protein [Deltaproteobacteria bacterium]